MMPPSGWVAVGAECSTHLPAATQHTQQHISQYAQQPLHQQQYLQQLVSSDPSTNHVNVQQPAGLTYSTFISPGLRSAQYGTTGQMLLSGQYFRKGNIKSNLAPHNATASVPRNSGLEQTVDQPTTLRQNLTTKSPGSSGWFSDEQCAQIWGHMTASQSGTQRTERIATPLFRNSVAQQPQGYAQGTRVHQPQSIPQQSEPAHQQTSNRLQRALQGHSQLLPELHQQITQQSEAIPEMVDQRLKNAAHTQFQQQRMPHTVQQQQASYQQLAHSQPVASISGQIPQLSGIVEGIPARFTEQAFGKRQIYTQTLHQHQPSAQMAQHPPRTTSVTPRSHPPHSYQQRHFQSHTIEHFAQPPIAQPSSVQTTHQPMPGCHTDQQWSSQPRGPQHPSSQVVYQQPAFAKQRFPHSQAIQNQSSHPQMVQKTMEAHQLSIRPSNPDMAHQWPARHYTAQLLVQGQTPQRPSLQQMVQQPPQPRVAESCLRGPHVIQQPHGARPQVQQLLNCSEKTTSNLYGLAPQPPRTCMASYGQYQQTKLNSSEAVLNRPKVGKSSTELVQLGVNPSCSAVPGSKTEISDVSRTDFLLTAAGEPVISGSGESLAVAISNRPIVSKTGTLMVTTDQALNSATRTSMAVAGGLTASATGLPTIETGTAFVLTSGTTTTLTPNPTVTTGRMDADTRLWKDTTNRREVSPNKQSIVTSTRRPVVSEGGHPAITAVSAVPPLVATTTASSTGTTGRPVTITDQPVIISGPRVATVSPSVITMTDSPKTVLEPMKRPRLPERTVNPASKCVSLSSCDEDTSGGAVCFICMEEFSTPDLLREHEAECQKELDRRGLIKQLVSPTGQFELAEPMSLAALPLNSKLTTAPLMPPGWGGTICEGEESEAVSRMKDS